MPRIAGKIVRIPDRKTIVVNLGYKDGIRPSSIFSILGEPESVVDPFSDEVLGTVTIVKNKAKATRVEERFTIATTEFTKTYQGVDFGALGLGPVETVKFNEELRVDPEELEPWKAKSEQLVQVGDTVEVTVDPENVAQQGEDNDGGPDG